jgi:hypothetical protein
MQFSRLGGLLILGSCGLLVVAVVAALLGGSVSVGGAEPGGWALTAAMVLLGVGSGLLAVSGFGSQRARVTRVGLGLVAGGLLTTLATSNVSVSSLLVIVYLLGGVVFALGILVTAIGMLRTPGGPRRTGLIFIGGLALAAAAGGIASWLRSPDGSAWFAAQLVAGALALVAAAALIVGIAGVGVLALERHEPTTAVAR